MAYLIAQGPQTNQRWKKRLPRSSPIIMGRSAGWSVPWDEHISRQHARLLWTGDKLTVKRLADARNPLFFGGEACESCTLQPGQHFVIGSTIFSFADDPVTVSLEPREPAVEHTFTLDVLNRSAFRDAAQRLAVLSRLPEVIAGEDHELCEKLVELLLCGIPRASFAAVVTIACHRAGESALVVHCDQRGFEGSLRPSERLVREALRTGMSMAHVWSTEGESTRYTQAEAVSWALCTPIRYSANQGWCVYVAGVTAGSEDVHDHAALQDDVKFTELVADTIGRLRELKRLQRSQLALAQFISPVVLEQVRTGDLDQQLQPREAEVSVLFCDLRGFTRAAERAAHDLMSLLERVSRALGVMTRHILATGGVVGDFHGDAAMGFWGWPFEQSDRVERACRAALAISQEFADAATQPGHPLADFRIGIGMGTGRAVAGKIGTADQVKITVFGPVVNLAARLQELTKILRAPILLDEETAQAVRQSLSPDEARVRRIARLRPRGLDAPLMVSQLLPAHPASPLTDADLRAFEQAVDAVVAGDFERAFALLHHVPATDLAKDFLTVFIAQHHRQAPAGWQGVIELDGG